jgi:L-ascorbate metabolism protein UlaG (beta-lactamase superfamily)
MLVKKVWARIVKAGMACHRLPLSSSPEDTCMSLITSSIKRLVGLTPAKPEWFAAPDPCAGHGGPVLDMHYLGTAGFVIRNEHRSIVLDPFVSRVGAWPLLTQRLHSDAELVRQCIGHADDVLIGHAHHDHILDAPVLCQQTGARLIGSRSAIMVGRAAGLPAHQLLETAGREDIASGSWVLRGLPSRHGKVYGRVPFPGDITQPPPWPPRMHHLRHGLVMNWWVDTGGLRIVHIDSADFIPQELAQTRADVVCLCAVGRQSRANYVKEVLGLLRPRWVVPCHWDSMLTPIHGTPEMIPGVDLPGFIREIQEAGCTALPVPILGRLRFPQTSAGATATPSR